MKEPVSTSDAPAAIGPYSQGVSAGGLVFVSGQIPLDPRTGLLVDGDVAAQTRCVLANLSAILAAAGSELAKVVKTTVYLSDLADFGAVNAVYAEYFPAPYPARATIQAARLPRDVKVEIDAIALV